jgi:hypothetical protein
MRKNFHKRDHTPLTARAIASMRSWISECDWADLEPEEVGSLSDSEVVQGVRTHYAGGLEGFLTDAQDEETDLYARAIRQARDLMDPNLANFEYERGMVELIAHVFPDCAGKADTERAKEKVLSDLHPDGDRRPVEAVVVSVKPIDDSLTALIREALEGDSNDAEHDALVRVADALGIHYEEV